MKEIKIIRYLQSEKGTFGVMLNENGDPFCLTLELPWRDNRTNISCIPAGEYVCGRTISDNFGKIFEVKNVPKRTEILIHSGRTINDIKGCILVGKSFGKHDGLTAMSDSEATFKNFLSTFADVSEFKLIIQHLSGCSLIRN